MIRCMMILAACLVAGSCASSQPLTADRLPAPFELSLYTGTTDGRSTYFELKRGGLLRYGGGVDANVRNAFDVEHTTDAQRLVIWRIVHKRDLLDASGELFAEANEVEYDLHVRAGGRSNRIRAIDDGVRGLDELSRALFELQYELRFSD